MTCFEQILALVEAAGSRVSKMHRRNVLGPSSGELP